MNARQSAEAALTELAQIEAQIAARLVQLALQISIRRCGTMNAGKGDFAPRRGRGIGQGGSVNRVLL